MKVLNATNCTLKSKEEKFYVMYIVPQKTNENKEEVYWTSIDHHICVNKTCQHMCRRAE